MMKQCIPLLDEYQLSDQRRSQTDNSNNNTDPTLSSDLHPEKEPTRGTTKWNIFLRYLRLGGGCLVVGLPRYMQPGGLRRKRKLIPSSYLDALRGYAAWFVLNRHRFDLKNTWLLQRPFFRVTHGGEGMVDLFFVISGYVLSYRLLMSMRNQETGRMLDALASSTFRRYLRLYGSAGVATFVAMLLLRLRLIDIPWPIWVERKDTFFEQLWDWMLDFSSFCNPFVALEGFWYESVFAARYLFPTWTIPVEFRGSMVVFAFCTAVCKLSTKHRMMLCWITIALCYYWQAIYAALFLYGMFIADVSLGRHPQRLKPVVQLPQHKIDPTAPPRKQSIAARVGYVTIFIIALFLLGGPIDGEIPSPFPWQYLSKAIPKWGTELELHFWPSIGAFLLVFALESYPTLQKPLTTNFSQYLGDLSFGIYTMHQLVLWGFYERYLDPLRDQYLGDSNWARTPGMIVYYLAVLWAAECFMRLDSRVVRLGRYLQSVTFLKWEE